MPHRATGPGSGRRASARHLPDDFTRNILRKRVFHPDDKTMQSVTYSVFAGDVRLAQGGLAEVLAAAKRHIDGGGGELLLFFDEQSGRQVDFDLRGGLDEILARHVEEPARRGPGRPRLGVVAREVTLLPRHWEWLEAQQNGASAALRRLVEEARKRDPQKELARRTREAMSRFMTALAGDRPGYEDAARALFAGQRDAFLQAIAIWPKDVRGHLQARVDAAFPEPAQTRPA